MRAHRIAKQTLSLVFLAITLLCLVWILERRGHCRKLQVRAKVTKRRSGIILEHYQASMQNWAEVVRLTRGILAIQGHLRHLRSPSGLHRAFTIAEAAQSIVTLPEYSWLKPETLLGLSVNETNLRPWLRCERGKSDPKGWDCGLSQVRVTVFFRNRRKANKLCKRLLKSPRLSLWWTAKELTGYKNRYCRKHPVGSWRLRRCVLQRYNNRNRYWLRVLCFAKGIELMRRPRWNCRKARSLRWIEKAYK
jgi:hypothetical protein